MRRLPAKFPRASANLTSMKRLYCYFDPFECNKRWYASANSDTPAMGKVGAGISVPSPFSRTLYIIRKVIRCSAIRQADVMLSALIWTAYSLPKPPFIFQRTSDSYISYYQISTLLFNMIPSNAGTAEPPSLGDHGPRGQMMNLYYPKNA